MSLGKTICPGCQIVLKVAETFPARLRCPRCRASFEVDEQGLAKLTTATPSEAVGSRLPVLGAVIAVSVLVLLLAGGLLAYCLHEPPAEAIGEDEDAPAHISKAPSKKKALPLEPVAAIKRGPHKTDKLIAVAFDGVPPDGAALGIAKPISSPPPPPPPVLSEKDKKINAAIDNGVAFLLQGLDESGRFAGVADPNGTTTGAAALTGLTLLSCGVAADHPKVLGLIRRIRSEAPGLQRAYDVAVCIWFLDKLEQAGDRELIRKLALRLVANQDGTGCWDYQCNILLTDPQEDELERLLVELPDPVMPAPAKPKPAPKTPAGGKLPQPMPMNLKHLPVFEYKPGQRLRKDGRQDNSLTQFAVLALWAAKKHDVPTQRSLAFAEAHFRQSQNPDGTWPYVGTHAKAYCNDSMTCAGLLGLAVGRGLDKSTTAAPRDLGKDPHVEKALVYLGKRVGLAELGLSAAEVQKLRDELQIFTVKARSNTKAERDAAQKRVKELDDLITTNTSFDARGKTIHAASWGDYYFLWSLERTAVVYDLATIGGKDWYEWGADIIVKNQSSDGCWRDSFPGLIDTCFALLFLKRANVVQDLTTALRDLGGATDPGAGMAKTTVPTPPKEAAPPRDAIVAGINKVPVVSSQPGLVKPRSEPALPAGNRPQSRARRRRR
jgi:hypothetical protein